MTDHKNSLANPEVLRAYLQNKEKTVQAYITEIRKYNDAVIKFSPHWAWMDNKMRSDILIENLEFAEKAGKVLANIRKALAALQPDLEKAEKCFVQEEEKTKIKRIAAMLLANGMTSTAFDAVRAKEITRGVWVHEMLDQYPEEIKAEMKAQYKK